MVMAPWPIQIHPEVGITNPLGWKGIGLEGQSWAIPESLRGFSHRPNCSETSQPALTPLSLNTGQKVGKVICSLWTPRVKLNPGHCHYNAVTGWIITSFHKGVLLWDANQKEALSFLLPRLLFLRVSAQFLERHKSVSAQTHRDTYVRALLSHCDQPRCHF